MVYSFVCGFRFWPILFTVLRFWMNISSVLRFLVYPNAPLFHSYVATAQKLAGTFTNVSTKNWRTTNVLVTVHHMSGSGTLSYFGQAYYWKKLSFLAVRYSYFEKCDLINIENWKLLAFSNTRTWRVAPTY